MKPTSILLVQPQADNKYSNVMLTPNLGLISLYSSLTREVKKNTIMLDGDLTSNEYIINYIKQNNPDIVAISANSFNYGNALEIAKYSKKSIIGGPHANYLYKHKFQNLPFAHIVSGNGNTIFSNLISGEISEQFIRINDFNSTPVLDYSILLKHKSTIPSQYMESFPKEGLFKDVNLILPIFTQYKCDNIGKKACKFCNVGRGSKKVDYNIFEQSYKNLMQLNPDLVWLVDGDISSDLNHLNHLIKIFNKQGNVEKYAFVRVDNLLQEKIPEALKEANIKSVFVGYEHGNNKLLNDMGKCITNEQSLEATKKLSDLGIDVGVASFILGTPSETKKSLDNLVKFIENLSKIGNVKTTQANLVIPVPGSIYWNQYTEHYKTLTDKIDLIEETANFQRIAHSLEDGVQDRATIEDIHQAKNEIDKIIKKGMEWI